MPGAVQFGHCKNKTWAGRRGRRANLEGFGGVASYVNSVLDFCATATAVIDVGACS